MKQLKSFLKLFIYLSEAGQLIHDSFYSSELKQKALNDISILLNQAETWDKGIIIKFMKKFEKALDNHPDDRTIKVSRILMEFKLIAPFLNIASKKEFCSVNGKPGFKIGKEEYGYDYHAVYETLMIYLPWEYPFRNFEKASLVEKYIIRCFHYYMFFFYKLNELCNSFGIDLDDIQSKLELMIWGDKLVTKEALNPELRFIENNATINKDFSKLVFVSHIVDPLFNRIKEYFNENDQPRLKEILSIGRVAGEKLIFRGKANQLADIFKQLYENDLIIGCTKKDLQVWLVNNFFYQKGSEYESLKLETVDKTISREDRPCKHRIIHVKDGQILTPIK